jgi:hypothetical protein
MAKKKPNTLPERVPKRPTIEEEAPSAAMSTVSVLLVSPALRLEEQRPGRRIRKT